MSLPAIRAQLRKQLGRPLLMSVIGAEQFVQMAFDDAPVEVESPHPEAASYAPIWLGEPDDDLGWGMTLKNGVALLCIEGPLFAHGETFWGHTFHGYDTIAAALTQAFEDPRVEGIFIHMDSPGGVVHDGLFELTQLIRDNRAAAGGKPVHVHADMMASAAYWIGSQADRVTANRTGNVGSIGAVIVHTDVSGALDRQGVRVTPVQGGARKTEFASFKPLDEEAQRHLQAKVDQAYSDFVHEVNLGRPSLSEAELYATEARLLDAHNDQEDHSAIAHGLIDAIERESAAFQVLIDLVSTDTPAAGLTPTNVTQSSVRQMETAMSALTKALAALSGDGKAPDRIASALAILSGSGVGKKATAILAGEGPTKTRILRAKNALLAAMEDDAEEEEAEGDDPEAEGEDPEAEGDDPDAEDEDAEGDDPDAEDEEAEGDDPDAEDEDAEGDDSEKAMARAKAILALPEAKGRQALATELAFTKGMTAAKAGRILRAAGKVTGRATPTDPKLSSNGNGPKAGTPDALANEVLAAAKAAQVL